MVIIRYPRLKRFRKKSKKLILLCQLVSIWYLVVFIGAFLTTNTGAYFNDTEVIDDFLHVQWDEDKWDKSSLDFSGSKAGANGCKVYTTIKNGGDDMTFSTWRFYLFKLDKKKNPIGDPIATGIVPNIPSKKSGQISTDVSENDTYAFTVRRPKGHPANNNPDTNGYTYIGWSDPITVAQCKVDK